MDWLNNNWKKYLEKNDNVLLHTVIDDRVTNIESILGGMFFGLFFAGWSFGACTAFFCDITMAMCVALVCFLICCIIVKAVIGASFQAVHYVLTNKGVYKISGLIYKRVKFVPYNRITDAEMTCGIIGHICDTADIGICTASGNIQSYSRAGSVSKNEIDIKGIRDYERVRQLILGKIK